MSTAKKKKRKAILILNIGDTVKLSKGRIGLVRFIGKTQFGLGEWIGIDLYNKLVKTRHNGAVLGKRYFRCPAHRGIFVRRQLIKENIPVKQIDPSIKNLRKKEKELKDKRKKLLKKQKNAKKQKNTQKRETKLLKERKKYSNLTDTQFKAKIDEKYNNKNTEKNTCTDIDEFEQKEKQAKPKQNVSNDIDCDYDWSAAKKKTELKKLKSEFSSFSLTIDKKIKDKKSEKNMRNLWLIGSKVEIYSYSNEAWYVGEIIDIKMEAKEWLQITYLDTKFKEVERYSDDIRPIELTKVRVEFDEEDMEQDSLSEEDEEEELQFKKELEEDFEQNYEHYHDVIDEYEHQIDHFEVARKNLATKLMQERKKKQNKNDAYATADISNDEYKKSEKKSRRALRSAKSRRASAFVDANIMADALFFDATEQIDMDDDMDVSDSYDSLNETEEEDTDDEEDEDEMEVNEQDEGIRNIWKVGSRVEIYSYSYQQWFLGDIMRIKMGCDEEDDGQEWLEVKYLESKFKEIQRHSRDIRPIQIDMDTQQNESAKKTKIELDEDDIEQDSLSEEEEEEEEEKEIFDVIKDKRNIKIITFFVALEQFMSYVGNENGFGVSIEKIRRNKYGKPLYVETGLESGWLITKIDGDDISQMTVSNIGQIIGGINENNGAEEYTITFERKDDEMCPDKGSNLKPSVYVRSKKNLHSTESGC